jgi:outer membrane protein OmpA-like peptidoglycan-associated protein
MQRGNRWCLVWALGCLAAQGEAQCLRIRGTIRGVDTQAAVVAARMTIRTKENVYPIKVMNGRYQTNLPCGEATLVIEAEGYGRLMVPYRLVASAFTPPEAYVPLMLMPVARQTSDQPYLQSEQSHTELQRTGAGSQQNSRRIFQVTDAQTDRVLAASVCLFYTQTARKYCFTVGSGQPQEITFTEPDIIALEVDAPGYQPYRGNLMLSEVDRLTRTYTIHLQREVTIVALTAPRASYAYSLESRGESIDMIRVDANHFYMYTEPGDYQLSEKSASGEVVSQRAVLVRSGLNILVGFDDAKDTVKHHPAEVVHKLGKNNDLAMDRLYFDQSDYQLRPASRTSLDSLAAWLRQHPGQRVVIRGHTDNVGNARRNQTLSEFRAKVVFTYLTNRGVPEAAMEWSGFGSQWPDASNDTEAGRRQNRRVEIFLPGRVSPLN